MFFWCLSGARLMTLGQSEREMQALDFRFWFAGFSEMFFLLVFFSRDGVDIVMVQMTF